MLAEASPAFVAGGRPILAVGDIRCQQTILLVIALVGNALMVGSLYGKMTQNMASISQNQERIESRLETIEDRLYSMERGK